MMNTKLDPKRKALPLLIIFFLAWNFGLLAQEGGKKEEKASSQSPQSQTKTAPPLEKKVDQEEYYEVPTPFGIQRYPKRPGAAVPTSSSPQPALKSEGPLPSGSTTPPPKSVTPISGSESQTSPATSNSQTAAPAGQSSQSVEPQTTSTSPPASQSPPVKLLFDRADLLQVINVIANDLLRLNYIVAPSVKGVVTINTAGEFRREDLFPLLETILQFNSCAIFKTGNLYQIAPAKDVKQLPIPVRPPDASSILKEDEATMLQVLPMRHVAASEMSKILGPYLSETGHITIHSQGNILIITESAPNLKKLLDLVNIFDADVFQNRRVQLYPILHNRAKGLVKDLETVFSAYALSGKDSAVRFISIDRINSILAISPTGSSLEEVNKWIAKLDQPVQNSGVRNFFYKVENGDARQIGGLLLRIYGKKRDEDKEAAAPFPAPGGQGAAGPMQPSPEGEKGQEDRSIAGYIQGEIKIVADEVNNGLIIQCSAQDYETIRETLKELDRVPRQVLIDAKIYEVSLSGALSFGVSAYLQQRTNQPHLTTASFSGQAASPSPSGGTAAVSGGLNAATFAFIGNSRELLVFLNAQETKSRTKVLSAPSIVASDNQEAKIQVGTEVPMLSSQGVVPGGQVGGTSLFSNTIQNRATGIILNVTPRINPTGWVTMKLNQEVSSPVAPTAGSSIQSPSISIRSVSTQVTVKDGETIAIGGIISESKLSSKNRIPFLGDIPGVGVLFGSTSNSTQRTELIALITPHVIQDIDTATDTTDELKSRLKDLKKELQKNESIN